GRRRAGQAGRPAQRPLGAGAGRIADRRAGVTCSPHGAKRNAGRVFPGLRRFAPPSGLRRIAGATMIQVRRLGHASFSTPDLDRQVDYYGNVLRLRIVAREKARAFLACRTGLEAIALERGDAVALKRLSFQVAPGSDLAATARELGALGIKGERRSGISPGVGDALVFPDIKGTLIELFTD